MKKIVCLLFLLLTACATTIPIPTATPAVIFPTPSPTVEPTATPDVIAPVLNDLQKNGIDASHENSVWILIFGGVEIPNALLNEKGFTVTTDSGEINVPLAEMNTRVENANGSLVIKDKAGKAMAVFDSVLGKWLNPDQMFNGMSTLVENIPFAEADYLTSTEFAAQVLADEANGKFQKNPDAVGLSVIDPLSKDNQNFRDKYGFGGIFEINPADALIGST
jgi:hypothetical protein